jgi:hypothetical protein
MMSTREHLSRELASDQLTLTQQITLRIHTFPELFANGLRTSFHDELLNHGRNSRRIWKFRELTMKGFNRLIVAVFASSLLAAPAVYAAPASISSPVHAMFAKTKSTTVKLSLRNDSGSAMEVKVGDKVMTLDPGKPVTLNLEVGTRIVANSTTPNHAAGSLIEEVISDHNGATIVIR